MSYDYQTILKETAEKNPVSAKKLSELREKRKQVVGPEIGINVVGEIDLCRPTLDGAEFIKNFRILRMVGLQWNLSSLLGSKAGDGIVYSIGIKLGRDLVTSNLVAGKDPKEFIINFAKLVENLKIGVISVVEWKKDFPNILKIDECISCAGMSNVGEPVCHYEGGIIAGVLSEYFKTLIVAKEVICWGDGGETCQFELYTK
ncbi:MAG: hypothetical protein KAI70_06310 [Candidatus Omnitrophica bacterium]|nr:hypothetical protein [Candidatus Omnitrophota bacterium]